MIETLQAVGAGLFAFMVLPQIKVLQGIGIFLGCGVIPAMLKLFIRPRGEQRRALVIVVDVLCLLAQLSAMVVWPVLWVCVSVSVTIEYKFEY